MRQIEWIQKEQSGQLGQFRFGAQATPWMTNQTHARVRVLREDGSRYEVMNRFVSQQAANLAWMYAVKQGKRYLRPDAVRVFITKDGQRSGVTLTVPETLHLLRSLGEPQWRGGWDRGVTPGGLIEIIFGSLSCFDQCVRDTGDEASCREACRGQTGATGRRVEWLGGPPVGVGAVPGECFGMPGFDQCYNQAYDRARSQCDPAYGGRADHLGYETITKCITVVRDEIANAECVPQFCATGTRVPSGMVYGETVKNPITLAEQQEINAALPPRGFQKIVEDGKLGPKTCGAAAVSGTGIPSQCFGHESEWEIPSCIAGKTYNAETKSCEGEALPPPPSCPPGTRRNVATGQCDPFDCPEGQQLDMTTNQCIDITPAPTAGKKKKSNTGLILLGAAALAAGAFALM